jgi:pimeloyl-ACP methyl ester carboxylesterase
MDIAMLVGRIALIAVAIVAVLLVLGLVWEALSASAARRPAPGRLVDVGGGRRIHIRTKGDAPGPTVVLEMGDGEPTPYWWAIQDAVAAFARVCIYDRTGYGWSSNAPPSVTLEGRAADLHALLAGANIPGPYVLVGHSLGGPLVRLYARDHLDTAAGFVFVDTPDEAGMFREGYLAFVRKSMKPMVGAVGLATRFGVMRALRPFGISLTPVEVVGEARSALAATRSPRTFRTAIAEFDSLLNAPAALRREHGLGGPLGDRPLSVITHGVKFPPPYDALEVGWDDGQKRLAALSSNSELIVAEKSNHAIQHDEPDVVIDAIRRVHAAARDGERLLKQALE